MAEEEKNSFLNLNLAHQKESLKMRKENLETLKKEIDELKKLSEQVGLDEKRQERFKKSQSLYLDREEAYNKRQKAHEQGLEVSKSNTLKKLEAEASIRDKTLKTEIDGLSKSRDLKLEISGITDKEIKKNDKRYQKEIERTELEQKHAKNLSDIKIKAQHEIDKTDNENIKKQIARRRDLALADAERESAKQKFAQIHENIQNKIQSVENAITNPIQFLKTAAIKAAAATGEWLLQKRRDKLDHKEKLKNIEEQNEAISDGGESEKSVISKKSDSPESEKMIGLVERLTTHTETDTDEVDIGKADAKRDWNLWTKEFGWNLAKDRRDTDTRKEEKSDKDKIDTEADKHRVAAGEDNFKGLEDINKTLISQHKADSRISAGEEVQAEGSEKSGTSRLDNVLRDKVEKTEKPKGIPILKKLKDMNPMKSVSGIFGKLFKKFGKVGTLLKSIGTKFLIPLVTTPVGWAVILGTVAVGLLWTFKDKIAEVIGSVWEGIKSGVDKAINFITEFFSGIKDKISGVIRRLLPEWAANVIFGKEKTGVDSDKNDEELANKGHGDQNQKQRNRRDVYRKMDQDKEDKWNAEYDAIGSEEEVPKTRQEKRIALRKKRRAGRRSRLADKMNKIREAGGKSGKFEGGVLTSVDGKPVDLSPEDQKKMVAFRDMKSSMMGANAIENNALNSVTPQGQGAQAQGNNNVLNAPTTNIINNITEDKPFNTDPTIRALNSPGVWSDDF